MNRKSGYRYLLPVVFAAAQFLPGLLPSVGAAQLIYENTFNSGWGDSRFAETPWQPSPCDIKQSFRLVPDPKDASSQVAKFFQPGNMGCDKETRHRTQIHIENPTDGKLFSFLPRIDYWVGFRVYIPYDFPAATYAAEGISTFLWGTAQATPGELFTRVTGVGSRPAIEIVPRYNGGAKLVYPKPASTTAVNFGEWTTVVVHFRREYTATGTIEGWINGVKVVSYIGNVKTATDIAIDTRNPVTKIGVYWGRENRREDVTLYYDDFRIATGADGYNLVNPSPNGGVLAPPQAPIGIQLNITSP